jgi:hypothetical protein
MHAADIAEAKAIHLLLNAVDRGATETAIANKIVAIGRELKGKSLERYAPGYSSRTRLPNQMIHARHGNYPDLA